MGSVILPAGGPIRRVDGLPVVVLDDLVEAEA